MSHPHRIGALLGGVALAALLMPAVGLAQTAATTATNTAPAPQAAGAVDELQEIIVTGTARSDGMKKLDASFAISTIKAEDIVAQQPNGTADLLKLTPGLWVESTSGTAGPNIDVRGFPGGGDAPFITMQIDGSPIYPAPTLSFMDNSTLIRLDDTVERVEVLRGGPATVFSNAQPGATVNFIQRKGTDTPEGSIRLTVGDEGLYRVDTYYGGPITKDLNFMVGGFYRYNEGIRSTQFPADDGGQVVANITKKFENGEFTFYGRRTDDKNAFYTAIPLVSSNGGKNISAFPGTDPGTFSLYSNDVRNVTIETGPGQSKNVDIGDGRGIQLTTLGNTLDLDLKGWQLSNKMNFVTGRAFTQSEFTGSNPETLGQFISDTVTSANANAAVVAAAGGIATGGSAKIVGSGAALTNMNQQVIAVGMWSVDKRIQSFTDDARLSHELFPGNTLTVGAYFAQYSSKDQWYLGNNYLLTMQNHPQAVDVVLNNGAKASRGGLTSGSFYALDASYDGTAVAGFISDEWKITPDLRLDAGFRMEHQSINGTISNDSTGDLDNNPLTLYDNAASYTNGTYYGVSSHRTEPSWTVGANYYLTDDLSVYARVNSGHEFPQFDALRGGDYQMVNIRQQEVGLKTSSHYYSAYVTGFHNTFSGLLYQAEVVNPDGSGSLINEIYGSEAWGAEFELAVRPVTNLTVSFRGTYLDAKYQDNPTFNGDQVLRQPKFQFSIAPSYEIPLDWASLRLFGTYTHVGDRYGDPNNQQPLPAYDTLDLGVSAEFDRYTVQLTGTNLTDELGITEGNARVVGSGTSSSGVFLGRPLFGRSIHLSAAAKF
ncbi:outer membrane receptor protein involved in Fe transport [Nitrospirillum amazonense]|uniref:Outer membrane receptor protein involved in Fe transport n=1 Tax=Nitrospirillum amazonense TaxID=28077 RepID=A0A560JBX9_9PROT|nr:outer membrane receptor protein involved in Fe transport [Nitrospirillum amazonense]